MNIKNTNNICRSFIVDYKLMIILLLVLITYYFGLIAEGLRIILSWEVELININLASLFYKSLIDLYFIVWYILIIALIGVLYIKKYFWSFKRSKKQILKMYLKLYNKNKYKKNIILKRFYKISNFNYVDPLKFINIFSNLKKGNIVTKKTLFSIVKKTKLFSNSKTEDFIESNKAHSTLFKHYSNVDGTYFNDNNIIKILAFSPYTTKNEHICYIDKKQFFVFEKKGLDIFSFKIPTLKTDIKTKYENLILPNKSIIKTYIPENLIIPLKKDEIFELDLEKILEIQLKEKKIMELLEKKDYEFINKDSVLYLVHKNFIKKEENLIIKVDFNNAEKITIEEFIKLGYKIANISELHDYLNVSKELKEEYLKWHEEYFKYIKIIKK